VHVSASLLPGKEPQYPFYRRLGWLQSRSGRCGEKGQYDNKQKIILIAKLQLTNMDFFQKAEFFNDCTE
jgi:hypothetical protein